MDGNVPQTPPVSPEPEKPGEQLAVVRPNEPAQLPKPAVFQEPKKSHKKLWLSLTATVVLVAAVGLGWWLGHSPKPQPATDTSAKTQTKTTTQTKTDTAATNAQGLQLDTTKNYGNKYADGLLPVGDGKYTASGPKQGYVYTCSDYAKNLGTSTGGAGTRGPWFTDNNTEYDSNAKAKVQGTVSWHGMFENTVSGSTRTITSNDLPISATTGIFPISSKDPAFAYDRNPNTISAQSFTYSLPASPTYGATPQCMGGQVGVMLNGVALFSAFDAGGRDAGAWEVQDGCSGHPQSDGMYHYHTLSGCIKNITVHDVIGFALDGFPITGPDVGNNNVLTTSDLDECHGITSQITLDGKSVTMYHYVMTQDFPYSVSCYRATPTQAPGQAQHQAGRP